MARRLFTLEDVQSMLDVAGVNFTDVCEAVDESAKEHEQTSNDLVAQAQQLEAEARTARAKAVETKATADKLNALVKKLS